MTLNPSPCLDLAPFAAGRLSDDARADFEAHLVKCAACRVRLKLAMVKAMKEEKR